MLWFCTNSLSCRLEADWQLLCLNNSLLQSAKPVSNADFSTNIMILEFSDMQLCAIRKYFYDL